MKNHSEHYDWERAVLRELYRDYEYIDWSRKLRLRPAAIALSDSETHWGTWDSLTRTISLSRKLVQNYNWFQVLGILKHEMAHQWIDEFCSSAAPSDRPHGETFRAACRIVGVPEQFWGASTPLQENPLDWRQEKSDEASEKLLDKVRKLLALATSSNEHEALLAMNKVRELYAKYNLDKASEPSESGKSRFVHLTICDGKKRIELHQDKIIGILVGHFFVQVLTGRQFDVKTGEHHRMIEVIGTRENALMAEYVYHFLLHQIDYLVREAEKTSKNKISRIQRKSYRLGILEGFAKKLELSEKAQSEISPAPRGTGADLSIIGQAMVKFKQDRQLDDYISKVYPRLGTSSGSSYELDGSAFSAGISVGKSITLNKVVAANDGNQKRLLSHQE
jgi:hypothetical protein